MDTIGKRLQYAASLKGEDPGTLAKKIGCSRQAIAKVFLDEVKTTGYLCPLSKILDCNPYWLFYGEGAPPDCNIKEGQVPLLSWQNIEDGIDLKRCSIDKKSKFKTLIGKGGIRSFAVKMYDESMSSAAKVHSIAIGDIIFVDPDRKPALLDIVVAVKTGDFKPVVRQYCADNEGLFLRPFNEGFRTTALDANTKIIGVVIGKSDEIISS